ncbi:MAG: type IX secretion system membrane protein PorP/SprF [Saprospiraceae bacterium]|uniref:Type IX secretion system membrane protein PorP/SprF n=1 Tax=Candidatus Opimibacter skivensis TaxID=2982028 RepID=A0A9D7STN5_9BACT|nr:type IX secretion system membrane protein PorP/SprF [Candidatus Opimibacter skivensis]
MSQRKIVFTSFFFLAFGLLLAQDPATFLFRQHSGLFNPALAGSGGSQSISLAYRNEWVTKGSPAYQTALLSYEESLPCSILDYGINGLWDQEGNGLLTTYEISPQVSANLPLVSNKDNQINIRLGAGISYGWQKIDFLKLVFSDQLDPKYGIIFPTNFSPPDENLTNGYFQPGLGGVIQMVLNKQKYNAIIINVGASMHNAYSLGQNKNIGYGKSILGLFPPQSPKFSIHADFELIPGASFNQFVSIKPLFLYEKQQALHYMQYGVDFGIADALRVGAYLHQQSLGGGQKNTNWISTTALFRPYLGKNRIDFYLTYSFNSSGLRNTVSPLIEIGIKKHFRNSPVCRMMGKGDDIDYSDKPICRYSRISPAKKKLYENIWYKNN